MARDRIRHLQSKQLRDGSTAWFWNPSKTLREVGLVHEALGTDYEAAQRRAMELNGMGDEMRLERQTGQNGPAPGSNARLFRDYMASEDFLQLKPRTQKDLKYYLGKIEATVGRGRVEGVTPKAVKIYHRELVKERGVNWAYHMIWAWRCALSWAVTEDWIDSNPALKISIKNPPKRTVQWRDGEAEAFIVQAEAIGWHSIAVAADLLDCTAQSPIDIWKLRVCDYEDGAIIDPRRAKTDQQGARILLWDSVKARLERYLASRPALHPDAPLLANDKTQKAWIEGTRYKAIAKIRKAAGLRSELQFQDFRRTAMTEARKAGANPIEVQHLARHASARTQERYIQPDPEFSDSAQNKRLQYRAKTKVE